MANEMAGLLGRKLGMTQMYDDNEALIPVTVVEVGTNTVLAVKRADGPDGYSAIQLGFGATKRANKAMLGHLAKANVGPQRHIRELRLSDAAAGAHTVGQSLSATDVFTVDEKVDVIGTSKGCGFAGVMKKYNFAGFIRSHGTHEFFRHGGSIGTRLTPGHVLKGKKMPGHMGSVRVTVQNMRLVKADAEAGLLYIAGGVPGANGALVCVRKAVKA